MERALRVTGHTWYSPKVQGRLQGRLQASRTSGGGEGPRRLVIENTQRSYVGCRGKITSDVKAYGAVAEGELALTPHTWTWQGHTVTYVTAGCGEPLVLIHGFGASWGHYKRILPELARKYKVYAIDLLGFGGSDKPVMDYEMEVWSAQIQDFLGEFVQSRPAILVGNSIGSLVGLMVAAESPAMVKSLVLLNCAGGMNNKAIADDWRIKVAMPLFLLIDWLLLQPNIARYLFDTVRQKENLKKILEPVYPSNPSAVDDQLVNLLHTPSCDEGALDVFVSTITGPPGPRPQNLVPRINCPLLLLWGTQDTLTPADGPVGKFFQSLPDSRPQTKFVFLRGVGHCPMDETPELVLQEISQWTDLQQLKDGGDLQQHMDGGDLQQQ